MSGPLYRSESLCSLFAQYEESLTRRARQSRVPLVKITDEKTRLCCDISMQNDLSLFKVFDCGERPSAFPF